MRLLRVDRKTWGVALSVALLAGLGALYATRPASPAGRTTSSFAGRTYPGTNAPDPLTADEIGYQVPRDRIKALDHPSFVPASQAGFISGQVTVIGVAAGGEAKAYPVPLMSRVEIVNDAIGGRAIAVTW